MKSTNWQCVCARELKENKTANSEAAPLLCTVQSMDQLGLIYFLLAQRGVHKLYFGQPTT